MPRARITGVYQIKNQVNGKVYIGSSVNIYHRWGTHKRNARRNSHGNEHLQNAWNKYGEESFEFTVLEETTPESLIDCENRYIKLFNSVDRGFGYNKGYAQRKPIINDETREKMAKAKRGRKLSEETKRAIGEAVKGKPRKHSEESKAKMSKTRTGRKMSEETKRKMSESAKKRVYTPEQKAKLSAMFKGKKRNKRNGGE